MTQDGSLLETATLNPDVTWGDEGKSGIKRKGSLSAACGVRSNTRWHTIMQECHQRRGHVGGASCYYMSVLEKM